MVVRVRPPRGNETPGAISINPDYRGMVIYREWVSCCSLVLPEGRSIPLPAQR